MADVTVVEFDTAGATADERLVREYLLDARDRLLATDACERCGFLRYGHDPSRPGGQVRLHLRGETELLVAAERDRWDELVEDGLARSWEEVGPDDDTETFGPRGDALVEELQFLATAMARPLYEEYDDLTALAPVDSYPGDGPVPAGWWTLLHFLSNHRALSASEEVDASFQMMRNRLLSLGARDPTRAIREIEQLQDDLDALRAEIDATRE
ncbi:hypothetical protein BRD16_08865 [Halobacteriales archaeon SW_6_65_46]|nr:MAG: hypothetical protein BRD16_08865 [Halobacteriales archaeon SW_6_65_46]